MRKTFEAFCLSALILTGCAGSHYKSEDIKIRGISEEYSMTPNTYNILINKIKTDNESYTDVSYDIFESKPELREYMLKKADTNNDKRITHHEARCLEDIWVEEF